MAATHLLALFAGVLLASGAAQQELKSGPDGGKDVPALKVFDATGPNKGKEIDYAKERKTNPTVYVFVQADKFDRSMARFLKKLEETLVKEDGETAVVAVWLTDGVDKTKDYLVQAQQSLQFQITALVCWPGEKAGPADWKINADAHLTAVVANNGKVATVLAYQMVGETHAANVAEAVKKARKKKQI